MEQRSQESPRAGPSSSSNDADPPPPSTTVEASPTRRTQRSSTPQSLPSTSPTASRNPSRSPSTSRRSLKRTTFSPVPEESHLIAQATSSTSDHPSEPASKKPRATTDDLQKRRGQRLFGVLTSTLTQFKRESETDRAATAASRRAQIEARSATKLALSSQQIDASERQRALIWEARSLAEQITTGDSQRKTLRGLKRRMASFLYTPTGSTSRSGKRLAEDIPTSSKGTGRRADEEGDFAVYFLPGKTLPEQEDVLNDQEDDVDDKIDRFDDRWEEERRRLLQRLKDVKAKIRET
ncbi:Pinin_SDK_memA domain-containing protein [Pseudozyma hubeiensis]|nr:Pinin_SDK_memA domain-containing protein [Pseudozyma hubeiensis]